ncbi:single-strand DNA-binding protein B [Streptococcus pneumoniae]|nr:single-strand DNA-binding protein B [Streptococcus pneumoniae]
MYNKVIMIGRLTSTPELHKTNNDKSVAGATIAVNRRYKDQNGEREADFVNMVLWGRLAETLASYATKGSLISVDGELRTRRFEKNGQMNYVTEVLVTGFQLLESRAQRAMRENNAGQDLADLVLEEEELPFLYSSKISSNHVSFIHNLKAMLSNLRLAS